MTTSFNKAVILLSVGILSGLPFAIQVRAGNCNKRQVEERRAEGNVLPVVSDLGSSDGEEQVSIVVHDIGRYETTWATVIELVKLAAGTKLITGEAGESQSCVYCERPAHNMMVLPIENEAGARLAAYYCNEVCRNRVLCGIFEQRGELKSVPDSE